jgi:hypothetical protein
MASQQHNHYDPRRQPAPSQSSPYAPHDGPGPYYAPPAYPCPAPMNMNRPSAGGGYMPPRASNVSPFVSELLLGLRALIDCDSTFHRNWFVDFAIGVTISHETDAHQFLQRQRVSVRITTDTWVMGVIISVVHIYSMVITVPPERTELQLIISQQTAHRRDLLGRV